MAGLNAANFKYNGQMTTIPSGVLFEHADIVPVDDQFKVTHYINIVDIHIDTCGYMVNICIYYIFCPRRTLCAFALRFLHMIYIDYACF